MIRDSRISHTWRRAALTHELAVDVLPDVCVASSPRLRHAHRLERTTCLGEPIDDVLIDHTMVLLLCANSERIGAGTCPCLNPRAYFLLGIYDDQFFRDGPACRQGSPPPPSSPPLCRRRPHRRPVHRHPRRRPRRRPSSSSASRTSSSSVTDFVVSTGVYHRHPRRRPCCRRTRCRPVHRHPHRRPCRRRPLARCTVPVKASDLRTFAGVGAKNALRPLLVVG